MEQTSNLATPGERSGYQSARPERKPSWAGIDLDPARRPGVPFNPDPKPMPNSRFPPERQQGEPAVPKHGRPNKPFPPVFGTPCPLHGLSGVLRRLAYRLPDHSPNHWMLMMLGDRIEWYGHRAGKLAPIALPLAGIVVAARIFRR
jgi:hypothetical protein